MLKNSSGPGSIANRCVFVAGVLLVVLSVSKVATLVTTQINPFADPVFPRVSIREMLMASSMIELAIGFHCLFEKSLFYKANVLWVFACAVIGYRILKLLTIGTAAQTGCGCLGKLESIFGLTPQVSNMLGLTILGFVAATAAGAMAALWKSRQVPVKSQCGNDESQPYVA